VSNPSTKNIPASVRHRLLNKAKQEQRPFNELLQYYGMERFLYRLSKSPYAKQFILKGGLMLRVWSASESRPTMDIDMLGRTSNNPAHILQQMQEILALTVEPDGMTFDVDSLQTEPIKKDADYQGIRVRCLGYLDKARIHIQVDLGFGDVVFPEPETSLLPTLLDYPAPQLLCYGRESAIAEKFEAMLKLGILNSRMKDFYDIWLLSQQFDFDGAKLMRAIDLTLKHRETVPSEPILPFTEEFAQAKQVQWIAFCKRLQQEQIPKDLTIVVAGIQKFLAPLIAALINKQSPPIKWKAGNDWKSLNDIDP
jgi:predicted nucleotidyltransferase component of viral defense system